MSNSVTILYNEQSLKVRDLGKVGLRLSSKVDDIFNLQSEKGTAVDNAIKRVVAAATKEDIKAVDFAGDIGADLSIVANRQETKIYASGLEIFTGYALLEDILKDSGGVQNFVLELQSNASSFFTEIGEKALNTFDMGEILYDDAIIQGSWDSTLEDGYGVVFAPVFYGSLEDNNFAPDTLRPHVKFRKIVESIVSELGWKLESKFLTSSFFENHLYLFGVGDDWSVRDVNPYQVEALTNASDVRDTSTDREFICKFSNELIDTSNAFDSEEYTAPESGQYKFLVRLWTDGGSYRAFLVDQNDTLLNEVFEGENDLGYIGLSVSTKIRIKVFQNSSEVVTLLAGSRIRIIRENDVEVGGLIDIASCLHKRPAKGFFDDITLRFCLAWYAHDQTKTIYCEPRLDYIIDGEKFEGFYAPPSTESDLKPVDWSNKLDQSSISIKINRAFGNSVLFRNKPEDSELFKEQSGKSNQSIPFLNGKARFGDYGKASKPFESPYFEDLLLVADSEFTNLDYMPLILNSEYDPSEDPINSPVIPEPTYKSNPKYGYYHGNITYKSWSYQGSILSKRPVITQRLPDGAQDFDLKFSASFSDFQDYINSNYPLVSGYLTIFYKLLFSMLKEAQVVTGKVDLSLDDFSSIDHRQLRILNVGGTESLYILLDVSGFDPINQKPANCIFLKYGGFHKLVSILNNRQTVNVEF